MSRLNFTPVDQAFTLGSSQIKDTQDEIAQLTKIIMEANPQTKKPKPLKSESPVTPYQNPSYQSPATDSPNYMRIGYPDQQRSVFSPPPQDSIDYNLMKVIGHPKFDEIVKNYALIYHPEWLLTESVYVPGNNSGPGNKSTFGNVYQSTVCSDVKKYLIFFITSVIIFIMLSIIF